MDSKKSWLDLGCGSGRIILRLASSLPKIDFYGVDISAKMLKGMHASLGRKNINNVHLIQADSSRRVPFVNVRFDVICLFQTIHFFDIPYIFPEITRLLSEKGLLIIATTTHEQFPRIPYCSYDPVCRYEIGRTPSYTAIVNMARQYNLMVKYQEDFEVYNEFKDEKQIAKFLRSLPYSAFCVLNAKEIEYAVRKSISIIDRTTTKRTSSIKFLVDIFRLSLFERT